MHLLWGKFYKIVVDGVGQEIPVVIELLIFFHKHVLYLLYLSCLIVYSQRTGYLNPQRRSRS